MKVLLLLAGQLRTFDNFYVQKSWDKFYHTYDVTTVGAFWSNRGSSLYNGDRNRHHEILDINYVKEKIKTDYIRLFDYENFIHTLPEKYIQYLNIPHSFDCVISNSFIRYQSLEIFKSLNLHNFDIAMLGRADLIFLRQLPNRYLEKSNILWHQNGIDSKAYYPDRIYDMFCISNIENIIQMCQFYIDQDSNYCIDLPSHNGLTQMDSTRVYFNYLNKKEIIHDSMDLLYVDAFREDIDIINYSRHYLNNQNLWGLE